MEFVIGNIDNILAEQKTELNDQVKITFGNINSKSELRRNMAQMAYFIMNDKGITPENKIKFITELQGIYNKAKEDLIKKKKLVEDEDEKVKTQQVELIKRIVLAKQPNRNGNLLKSIKFDVNSSKYPISARDQVDFFLLDIAEEFDMLMNPDEADGMLEEKLSRVIETTDKFIPNDFREGKNTDTTDTTYTQNRAAPKDSDVKSLQAEVEEIKKKRELQKEIKNAYSKSPLERAYSIFDFNKDEFPVDREVEEAYEKFKHTVDKKKAKKADEKDDVKSVLSNDLKSLGGKKRKTKKNKKKNQKGRTSKRKQKQK